MFPYVSYGPPSMVVFLVRAGLRMRSTRGSPEGLYANSIVVPPRVELYGL